MNALLIGLGNIGFKYDLDNKKGFYRTHSKALKKVNYFKKVSVVDIDEKKLKLAKLKYNFETFKRIKVAVNFTKPNFVIIATNTNKHYTNIIELINLHVPKIILIEKPISNNFKNVKKIINLCHKKRIRIFTNFIRRSEKSLLEIKKIHLRGSYRGKVYYNKGFLNNGSHWINLLEYLFGKLVNFSIISSKKNKSDKNISVKLKFKNHEIDLINDKNKVNSNYMIIESNNNQINYLDGGKNIFVVDKKKNKRISIKNSMKKYQLNVMNEIIKIIKKKKV